MAQVKVRRGEDMSKVIRRFKRKVEAEGILKDVKKRRYFLKPSMKKRVKRAEAAKRRRKTARRNTRSE